MLAHNTQTAAAPAPQDITSATAELQDAINQLTYNAYHNAPIVLGLIRQLQDVATQLSAGPLLDELNNAIGQLTWAAPNNAQVTSGMLNQLNDVWSQLTYGTETANPPDVEAIAELTAEILNQEPQWAPLLWVNWDGSTNLTVQVTGIYTLIMPIAASPWWTNWGTFYDAATQLVATIYLMGMATPPSTTMKANNGESRDSGACSSC